VWRHIRGSDALRELDQRALGHDDVSGETAVDREPCELVPGAMHVVPTSAGKAEPAAVGRVDEYRVTVRHGRHPRSYLLYPPCVLVAQDARQRHTRRFHEPLDRVQIGGTHAGATDPNQHICGQRGLRDGSLVELQRPVILAHDCDLHVSSSPIRITSLILVGQA
jgi:hypothetical protein